MLQPEIKIQRPPRIRHSYTCSNCTYNPEEKYFAIYKNGKLRILLEPIALTLFVCPKCKTQHVSRDFKVKNAYKKLIERRHRRNVERLKATYQKS